ncbi:hypothetical protein ACJMK2_021335, partial [Sinanodonta woodiana]
DTPINNQTISEQSISNLTNSSSIVSEPPTKNLAINIETIRTPLIISEPPTKNLTINIETINTPLTIREPPTKNMAINIETISTPLTISEPPRTWPSILKPSVHH